MKSFFLTLTFFSSIYCLFSSALPSNSEEKEEGKLWVLLVAGSSGWYNYRHQADVSHSYQVVLNHGVPKENIIVMMTGDIAYNKNNPHPGVIINRPNGENVYKNVAIDYNGTDNNPSIFLKVLSGLPTGVGTQRVIQSSASDRIFVYFSDHGGSGILGFSTQVLKATDLNNVIKKMHESQKYKEMVFYVEACESGSIFEKLLKPNWNVYATTASNAKQSSYACYYDSDLDTFLGDVYSVKWLEDADKEDLNKETLETQYLIVKNETTTSSVKQYGNMNISKKFLSEFLGSKKSDKVFNNDVDACDQTSVSSRDVPLFLVQRKNNEREIKMFLAQREFLESTVLDILKELGLNEASLLDYIPLRNYDCYYKVLDAFQNSCFNVAINQYALKFLPYFVNICESNMSPRSIIAAIDKTCTHNQNHIGTIL